MDTEKMKQMINEAFKKDQRRKYNETYWKKNREKLLLKKKKEYKENKERFQSANKRWLDSHRDHWNAYQREYRRRKKEKRGNEVQDN